MSWLNADGQLLAARTLRPDQADAHIGFTEGPHVIRIKMEVGKQTPGEIEHSIIEETLHVAEYNETAASRYLGFTRFALDRRLKKIIVSYRVLTIGLAPRIPRP